MEVSLQAGRVVGEHWRLQRRLGADITSRFWEAEDLRGGPPVAIEFVELTELAQWSESTESTAWTRAAATGPDARLRFSRETRALLKFRHPNVVRTFHRGIAGESLAFAVTELLRGEDLVARLAREPALGLPETARILDVVCRVVNRLEASNIPQRVLEPKQVFFAAEHVTARSVKLLNLGLANAGPRFGSPYVSPERAGSAAARVDGAAQVWAIGVLGYRMLAGELPFAPGTREFDAEWASRLVRLGESGDLPHELDDWFRTAIHPDPTQRFASVEQAGLAFGHIATTYASSTARVRRERPELREAAGGSVVTGMGRSVQGRGQTGAATGGAGRVADESGVVRVALPQAAVPSSSIPPAPDARAQFPLGRIPEPPSLARRAPEATGRVGAGQARDREHNPVTRVDRAANEGALHEDRSRHRAGIALAVLLGMLGGFALRSAIVFVEQHSRAAATLRSAMPPHAVAPQPPPPPVEAPVSATQPAAAAAPAPVSEPAAAPPAQEISVDPTPPRDVRPAKRAPRDAPAPSESLEPGHRPLVSSRLAPSNSQFAATREFPRGSSERIDALLPAAPPPIDTAPIQVYRGF